MCDRSSTALAKVSSTSSAMQVMLHFYHLHCPISRYLRLCGQALDGFLVIHNAVKVFIFPENHVIRNV